MTRRNKSGPTGRMDEREFKEIQLPVDAQKSVTVQTSILRPSEAGIRMM